MVNINKSKGNRKRKNLTINDIRAKYAREKDVRSDGKLWPYDRLLLGRVALYFTWLFLRLGISANKATIVGIIFGFVGCALLACGNYIGIIMGALALHVWAIFDDVDGQVARYTNTCSKYGAILDDLISGLAISALLFISVGIGAYFQTDPFLTWVTKLVLGMNIGGAIFLLLGGWASVFYILPRLIGQGFQKIFTTEQGNITIKPGREDTIGSSLTIIASSIYNTHSFVLLILLLAAIFKLLGTFVLLWAAINTCAFIVLIIQILRKARASNG